MNNKQRNKKIIELSKKGLKQREIAKSYGLTRQRIQQIVADKLNKYYALKRKILIRDDFQCQFCFFKKNLEIHHLDRNRKNNTANNLMVLCRKCHQELHWGKITSVKNCG